MKRLATLACITFGCASPLLSQQHDPQWWQEYDHSMDIAKKLFPDIGVHGTPMDETMQKIFYVWGKNRSRLEATSFYPVVLAIEAGTVTKTSPSWSAISSADQAEVFNDMQEGLLATYDFQPPGGLVARPIPTAVPTPAATSDNPSAGLNINGSLSDEDPNYHPPDYASAGASPSASTIAAFHVYLYQNVTTARCNPGGIILNGPFAGMQQPAATAEAAKKWVTMSDDEKAPYAQIAASTGDPIAQQAARNAANPSYTVVGGEQPYFIIPNNN